MLDYLIIWHSLLLRRELLWDGLCVLTQVDAHACRAFIFGFFFFCAL